MTCCVLQVLSEWRENWRRWVKAHPGLQTLQGFPSANHITDLRPMVIFHSSRQHPVQLLTQKADRFGDVRFFSINQECRQIDCQLALITCSEAESLTLPTCISGDCSKAWLQRQGIIMWSCWTKFSLKHYPPYKCVTVILNTVKLPVLVAEALCMKNKH